jgi:hypothetical protein
MIKAFKFRAQAIFILLEKTHPPGSQNLSSRNFFSLFYIISTQGSYIHQKLDTNSCFSKLRAISNLFSFFLYTLYNEQAFKKLKVYIGIPQSLFDKNAQFQCQMNTLFPNNRSLVYCLKKSNILTKLRKVLIGQCRTGSRVYHSWKVENAKWESGIWMRRSKEQNINTSRH